MAKAPQRTAPKAAKVIECNSCERTHHSADGIVPVGWATCQGRAWCIDCTRAGIPERELAAA